ncbi:MAG: hypothetical protein HY313_04940 [Acidobacteria bacterium]|nr:hypothetical protein [Acidobacteriota bacterium]
MLAFADPDLIYSYTPLPPDLARHIENEIHPWRIDTHRNQQVGNPPRFHPTIGHEQADTYPVWPFLLQQRWVGPRPKLLTSATGGTWPHRRRILRNFGLINENMAPKVYSDTQERISIQEDWTEARVFEELGTYQPVIFPFAASSAMTPFPEAVGDFQRNYCLVIGDDPQAWVYLWNRGLLFRDSHGTGWHTLCISSEATNDENYVRALRLFLQYRANRTGNNPATIELVSFTTSEEDLRGASDRLTHGLDLIPRPAILQPNEFPSIERMANPYPEFEWPGLFYFGSDRTTRQQVTFSKSLLRTPSSEVPLESGVWVMELRVEHPPQHKFYSNETVWFKVPRGREMARLFIAHPYARISADHSICSEMQREGSFELNVPDDYSVLLTALRAGMHANRNEDLGPERQRLKYEHIRLSEKGRYANGLLSLFGGLEQAGRFFEHSFWRDITERLSKRGTSKDEQALETITNKLSKHSGAVVRQLAEDSKQGINSLARYVLNLARQQHMTDEDITFSELRRIFQEQRERFIVGQSGFRKDNSPEGIATDQKAAEEDLTRTLQRLTESGIFLQGVRMHCHNCGSNYWQEVSEVRKNDKCPGCGAGVSVSVEAPWRYRLNTLVRNSIAFHGVIPVILTLHSVRSFPTRDSFFYAPGLALFEKYEDSGPAAELDFVCIADARLVVGEVKTSSSEFSPDELSKLANLARSVNADTAAIGAFLDCNGEMQQKKEKLQALLAGTAISADAVVPSPYAFEPTPHS